MNEAIALPRLAELMASAANIETAAAEKFIRTFFCHLEDALAVSESVTIKGLGTFARTSDPELPITFTADTELAAAVNQPFEMFEAIPVGDADLSQTTGTVTASPITGPMVSDAVEESAPRAVAEMEVKAEPTTDEPAKTVNPTPPAPYPTPQSYENEKYEGIPLMEYEEPRHSHTAVWIIFAFILGLILGGTMAFYGHDKLSNLLYPTDGFAEPEVRAVEMNESVEVIVVEDTAEISKVEIETAIPEELPQVETALQIYDTVTPNRFLTTMARQYYGQMEYWAFIYEANADKLGAPNRIKPGTRVLIPARSEFETDSTPELTLARAKRLGREIYERFE